LIGAGTNLNATNAAGESALLRVLSGRTFETVAALIAHHPSLEIAARRTRKPLMSLYERATAARLPHSRMLVAHGASLDMRNSLGNSAPDDGGARRRRKSLCDSVGSGRGRGTAQQAPECSRYRAGADRTAIAELMNEM
jgi:hypothetical protein